MAFNNLSDKAIRDTVARSKYYANGVSIIYGEYINKILNLVNSSGINQDEVFSLSDYPKLRTKVDVLLREMYSKVYAQIKTGCEREWDLANSANDNLVKAIFGPNAIEKNHLAKYFNHNKGAFDSFLNRKESTGLKLSDKVWNYTGLLKDEMDLALGVSIGAGKSAAEISREVRSYLQEPNKLFRRIRNEEGNLKLLSKAAKLYHPGQGVYRSSYKNAMRLTRTETNMAYRNAEHVRLQQLDFVVGFEIKLSKNHPVYDICDELKGKYPKDFIWSGWHPQCFCYRVTVLATPDELSKLQDKVLAGEPTDDFNSSRSVLHMPDNFRKWVDANKERGAASNSQPYFIKDNFVEGRIENGLKPQFTYIKPPKLAKPGSFVMNDDTIEYLQNKGYKITGKAEDYNKVLSGFDIVEFDSELNDFARRNNIEIGTKKIAVRGSFNKVDIVYRSNDYEIFYEGEERKVKGFKLDRSYYINADVRQVDHNYLDIDSSLQGKGTSKELFKILYKQYKNADIVQINVHANIDVGGYAWGRYGFCTPAAEIRKFPNCYHTFYVDKLSIAELKEATEIVDHYFKTSPDAKYFPMNILAEQTYGKRLLKGTDWGGLLDLRDAEQRAKFEDYLFSNKPK